MILLPICFTEHFEPVVAFTMADEESVDANIRVCTVHRGTRVSHRASLLGRACRLDPVALSLGPR